MSKLTFLGESLDLDKVTQVEVKTTATPTPAALLYARHCISNRADIAEILTGEVIDREALEKALFGAFPEETKADACQAALYLADEHEQIGQDGGVYLLSKETGQAIARLSPEDLYVPPPVPREDGSLAVRGPQVKPEVLAQITLHYHDSDREGQHKETLLAKVNKSNLLPAYVAERKAMVVTRKGRKQAASLIHDQLPTLVSQAKGIAKEMFDHFPLIAEPLVEVDGGDGGDNYWERPIDWTADIKVGIQDGSTRNASFDPLGASSAAVTTSWARLLGLELLAALTGPKSLCPEATEENLTQEGLYLAGPETSKHIQGRVLVVNTTEGKVVHLRDKAGFLCLTDYQTEHRDIHDKWTIKCTAQGILYVNWSKVRVYSVEIGEPEPIVEVI